MPFPAVPANSHPATAAQLPLFQRAPNSPSVPKDGVFFFQTNQAFNKAVPFRQHGIPPHFLPGTLPPLNLYIYMAQHSLLHAEEDQKCANIPRTPMHVSNPKFLH